MATPIIMIVFLGLVLIFFCLVFLNKPTKKSVMTFCNGLKIIISESKNLFLWIINSIDKYIRQDKDLNSPLEVFLGVIGLVIGGISAWATYSVVHNSADAILPWDGVKRIFTLGITLLTGLMGILLHHFAKNKVMQSIVAILMVLLLCVIGSFAYTRAYMQYTPVLQSSDESQDNNTSSDDTQIPTALLIFVSTVSAIIAALAETVAFYTAFRLAGVALIYLFCSPVFAVCGFFGGIFYFLESCKFAEHIKKICKTSISAFSPIRATLLEHLNNKSRDDQKANEKIQDAYRLAETREAIGQAKLEDEIGERERQATKHIHDKKMDITEKLYIKLAELMLTDLDKLGHTDNTTLQQINDYLNKMPEEIISKIYDLLSHNHEKPYQKFMADAIRERLYKYHPFNEEDLQ